MEGSFNLYRAQVRAFLHSFSAWGLVDGTVVRPVPAGPEQQQFDMLDFFVKDTLLRGVKMDDAERICDLSSGKEMWEDLEAHHTKQVFHAPYSREQKIDSWLQEIHDTRRALANLGRVIDDDLTVDVILMGVVHTHTAVVRQFSRIMTPGSRPTLQQVLNTLKSETEMDEIVRDDEEESGKIMHVAKKQKTDDKFGKENVGSKSENRGGKTCSKAGGNKRKKGVCHYCGKAGHYKIVCRKRQFDLKHGTVDRDANPGGGGGTKNGSKGGSFQPSPIGMIGRVENTCAVTSTGSTLASLSNLSGSLEWILDSAAITHTCADRLLILQFPHYTETNTPHEYGQSFVSTEDRFGHNGGEFPCKLNGVCNVPGCHVNLLSVNVLEEEGWKCETKYPTIGPPQQLMWKDDRANVFAKSRGYYRSRSVNTPARSHPQQDPPTHCFYGTFGSGM
ncbi:LOW QUALITY PROTEIN: Hypothetical protein PHPALM_6018 [Phytophthora palmivora]|uniref:CCHC-type domain-containing protein n=1 Tax=Phytophthora palmivora TaxID=4796 RepID=A0A2P4YFY5_9STRA|nr:LOW QUALITY PROTEIN: Hypothetical protein PHPALM_6018 [Phytophthora palmivora]